MDASLTSLTSLARMVVVAGLVLCTSIAGGAGVACAEECVASRDGHFSFSVTVSPRAGTLAIYDVHLFSGGTCDARAAVGSTTVGSSRRLRVTDGGVLVRALAPRARHRDWPIVELVRVAQRGSAETVRRLALSALPGTDALEGSIRVSFDDGALVLAARGGDVRISFAALEALVRAAE